jgi:hypothetical protein
MALGVGRRHSRRWRGPARRPHARRCPPEPEDEPAGDALERRRRTPVLPARRLREAPGAALEADGEVLDDLRGGPFAPGRPLPIRLRPARERVEDDVLEVRDAAHTVRP